MLPLVKTQFENNKLGWKKSFCDWFSQDENGCPLPWMSYAFIEHISDQLTKNQIIFEFGLGSSTFFFAARVKKVVVIESNRMWCQVMKMKLENARIDNVEVILMEDAMINNEYETAALRYAKAHDITFDFIFVDSMKRMKCLRQSIDALKVDGKMVLDDSQRKSYRNIFSFFATNGFKQEDFPGIAPGQLSLKNTTIFYK